MIESGSAIATTAMTIPSQNPVDLGEMNEKTWFGIGKNNQSRA